MFPKMSAELGTLRTELRDAGVFEHRELRSWLELAGLGSALAACLVGIVHWGPLGALALIPVAAVFATSIAMYGHGGSHRSFSSSPFRNQLLTTVAFPLFSGLGTLYWHNKHDRLHHGHPNVEGKDPDIRPFPFASSAGDHAKCGRAEQWFQRNFQRWMFWPMSTLMTLGMRRSSINYLLRYPNKHTAEYRLEVVAMALHYVCWLVIPALIWGPLAALVVYAGIWALVGVFLALVFAPAHMGLPVMADQHHDWLHQLETTRNLEMPRLMSFFFVGLDYQVEHHLFPKIPHHNLPRAAEITRRWCAANGVVYHSTPYLHALVDSVQFMANAWERDSIPAASVRIIRPIDVVMA